VPFTEASLRTEKPRVNQECDTVAKRLATHKFALHAWNQGVRFGQTNVALKGDVLRATLPEVQRFRDERLAVSNRVTVCFVGGLAPDAVFGEAAKELGGVRLRPGAVAAGKDSSGGSDVNDQRLLTSSPAIHGDLDLRWDLDARHLLLTWPIPDFRQPDHAVLLVAACCLNQSLATDGQLTALAGMSFAGADLATPEGSFFYVSASLRAGSDFDKVGKAILGCVGRLSGEPRLASQASLIGQALSTQLTEVPSVETLMAQVPAGMKPGMVEANMGLQIGMAEHRYGAYRATLARQLAAVSAADIQRVARKFLADEHAAVCTIKPADGMAR
jgi:hypothetical protein